jgi:hypothetical protein
MMLHVLHWCETCHSPQGKNVINSI